MTATQRTDLLIVGAGPVGLFGAYYAGVRGLSVTVIDSLSQVGGQVSAMYPEKQIYDIAGFPAVTGRELVAQLVEQAGQYDPTYVLGEEAQQLERVPSAEGADRFIVTTSSGREIDCGAVIVTGGIGTFTPRPLPAGEDHLGRGLDYFVTSVDGYVGREVVIVGGGDSALDWAMMLEPVAKSVTLVHRREAFRAHAAAVATVRESTVEILTNTQVTATEGAESLERATVTSKDGDTRTLECQRVIAALGFTANLGPLREWGVELHDNRHLVVDSAMRTSIPGIFSAGDITDYDGKVRLIAVGFGEVATAVNNAALYIDPDAQLFPGHSTDQPANIPTPA